MPSVHYCFDVPTVRAHHKCMCTRDLQPKESPNQRNQIPCLLLTDYPTIGRTARPSTLRTEPTHLRRKLPAGPIKRMVHNSPRPTCQKPTQSKTGKPVRPNARVGSRRIML